MNSSLPKEEKQTPRMICRPLLSLLLCLFAIAGCAEKTKPVLETFPVTGQILVNGKPAIRAEVRLRPKNPLNDPLKRSVEPYGFVAKDGLYRISTYKDQDGAPPGEYFISVVWPTVTIEGGEEVFGPDRLQGRYSNPASPVATFTVVDGSNLIPTIELTAP